MNTIKTIYNITKIVAKYGAVIMVFIKSIEYLNDELQKLQKSVTDNDSGNNDNNNKH